MPCVMDTKRTPALSSARQIREEIERAPAESIELPHEHRVDLSSLRRVEHALQAGTAVRRPSAPFAYVERHAKTEPARGRGELASRCVRVLVDGRHAVVEGGSSGHGPDYDTP